MNCFMINIKNIELKQIANYRLIFVLYFVFVCPNILLKATNEVKIKNLDKKISQTFAFAGLQYNYAFVEIDKALAQTNKKNLVNPRSINKDGSLRMITPRDWCSGFFPGSLWLMYEYTNDPFWKQKADKHSRLIENEKFDKTSHDVGFKINCSFGRGYKITNNPEYRKVILQAAKTLSMRFDNRIGAIRSWDWNRENWEFPVIIDNMMNLELLFEATRLTGDSSYYTIAETHAFTTLKNHFRPDNSSCHLVDFDLSTGLAQHKQTVQGFSNSSTWARGQSWGLYGFTMSYRYTRNPDFLKQAEAIAGFLLSHPNLPRDFVPYWDFNDPKVPETPRDVSAASVMASALYELSDFTKNRQYIKTADKIMQNIMKMYLSPEKKNHGFLLLHATGNLPLGDEIDVPLSYADYYFLEALLRRKNLRN